MEEEHDRAVFYISGRRARRHEASSDGYIIERDASNGFVVEELLAEAYESLRVGKGSGCSPPCVTRWSGGAVVHDRGALLRRGLRRRTTTHHVVELGSQHYRGQFNVVPGTVFFGAGCHFFMRSQDGGRRRAVDALDGHRFLVVVVQLLPRGDGCTARRSVQHGCPRPQRFLDSAARRERTRRWYSSSTAAPPLRLL